MKVIGGAKIINGEAFCKNAGLRLPADPKLSGLFKQMQELDIVKPETMENFHRDGTKARMAQLLAWLTIYEASLSVCHQGAVLGWNGTSCIAENRAYFTDYLSYGRESGQGKLFVATLPSTPAAAVAIALQISGHVYYYGGDFTGLKEEIEINLVTAPMVFVLAIADAGGAVAALTAGNDDSALEEWLKC